MEFIGKVLYKWSKEAIGAQGLEKQSIVIEEGNDKQYKDSIMVDFFGEKCGLIADFRPGDIVKILFNPRAKEYNGKRYNSMSGWKAELVQKSSGASSAPAAAPAYNDNDDLPF
jgi:single-strand DNA-binding protein